MSPITVSVAIIFSIALLLWVQSGQIIAEQNTAYEESLAIDRDEVSRCCILDVADSNLCVIGEGPLSGEADTGG